MRILIIDDEVHVATLLAEAVRRQGHEARVALDGEEGLSFLPDFRPDVVFLDVKLGELGGIEVLRRIRGSHPTLSVVLITGRAGPEELKEARRLGVTGVIHKPDVLKRLTDVLAQLDQPD